MLQDQTENNKILFDDTSSQDDYNSQESDGLEIELKWLEDQY